LVRGGDAIPSRLDVALISVVIGLICANFEVDQVPEVDSSLTEH